MKQVRIFFLISCFVMTLFLSSFSFSDTSTTEEALATRIKKCISCCDERQVVCYHKMADMRLCYAVFQECVATCNSEGKSPSEWSDCWSQSDK
jgi:hypothetical protein